MKPEARRNPAAPYSASASPSLPPVSSFAAAFPRRRRIPGHTGPCAPSQIHTEPTRGVQMPGTPLQRPRPRAPPVCRRSTISPW